MCVKKEEEIMTTPLPLSIERIGYTTEYPNGNTTIPLIENIVREVVETAVGVLQPSPTFIRYIFDIDPTNGQLVLLDASGNKVNDTDRAPIIFCVCDVGDITKSWNSSSIDPRVAYYAAHCFLLCITPNGSSWSTENLRQTRVLTAHPPQQGLAMVNFIDWVHMKFAKDGVHSVEAIPIIREALLKVFPPPPPPSQDKDQTQQGKEEESKDEKEEKTMTGRPYILLVVITLVILLCLIGGVVYMAS